MKVVGLVSGGKDSIYSLMKCKEHGHDVVALAHLSPPSADVVEMDSFMFQTAGSGVVRLRMPLQQLSPPQVELYVSPNDGPAFFSRLTF